MTALTTLPQAIDYKTPISNGISTFTTFIPKLVGFLVILLIGYFIAKAVSKVLEKVLERVGFDDAVEKGGIKKALEKSQYDASDIVAKIVFYVIFIPFLSAGVGALGIQALEQPLTAFITLLPKIVVAIVLVVIGAVIAGALKKLVEGSLGGLSYGSILANAVSVLVLLGFVKAALDEVGIATQVTGALLYTVLATTGGVIVVGVGGGLIKPMSERWDAIIDKASDEASNVKNEASSGTSSTPPARVTSRTTNL